MIICLSKKDYCELVTPKASLPNQFEDTEKERRALREKFSNDNTIKKLQLCVLYYSLLLVAFLFSNEFLYYIEIEISQFTLASTLRRRFCSHAIPPSRYPIFNIDYCYCFEGKRSGVLKTLKPTSW